MDKIFTIKERILQFIEKQGIKKEEFYTKTEITASNFKGAGLKSEIGGNKLVKILTIYPEINSEWLIIGKGQMLKGNGQNLQLVATKESDEDLVLLKENIKLLNKQFEEIRGDENKPSMHSMLEFIYNEMKKRSILDDLDTLEKMIKEKKAEKRVSNNK